MNVQLPDLSQLWPALLAAVPASIAIIVGAVLLNFIIGRLLLYFARQSNFTPAEIAPARRVVKWLIATVAAIFVFGAFGLNVGGLWGVLSTVLAMVAIGFVAVWSVLSNTLCTLIILVFRPFSVGDEIQFVGEAVKGRVIDLNFIYTTLAVEDDAVMQIPNNMFFQKVIWRKPQAHPQSVSLTDQLRSRVRDHLTGHGRARASERAEEN